jgi:alpha 1,6-mannosyltransferase
MDEYLNTIYPSGSPMSKVLQSLPMPVLKADILRYTILLHKGGIYSDIDTAAVRKFDDWGHDAVDMARVISNPFLPTY